MYKKYICNKLVGKKYGIKEKVVVSLWNVVYVYIWIMVKYCIVGFSMVMIVRFFKCYSIVVIWLVL